MSKKFRSTLFVSSMILILNILGCSSDDPAAPQTTGTIVITVEPNDLTPAWTLSSPGKADTQGTGSQTLAEMEPGLYTLIWDDVIGYITPTSDPQTLVAGGTTTFSGTYVQQAATGTIVIGQAPDVLAGASWSLTGPQNETGSGDTALSEMPVGHYTLSWSSVDGYMEPPSSSQILVADGTVTFDGVYVESIEGFELIPPVSVPMPQHSPWAALSRLTNPLTRQL